MNYKTTVFVLCSIIAFTGCSDSKTETSQETKVKEITKAEHKPTVAVNAPKENLITKEYTMEEIFNSMCIECHRSDGSGNTEKLTPSMIGQSEAEIRDSLLEIEADVKHVVMEHNREKILEQGMEYSAQDMAKYMHTRFNK